MEKVLLLCGKKTSLFDFEKTKINVTMDDLYNKSLISKYLIHLSVGAYFAFEKWKSQLSAYDAIIVFDSNLTKQTIKAFAKLKFSGRKILFFRNQVTKRNLKWDFDTLKKLGIEIWSYNLGDCKRYGFKYNNETLSYKRLCGVAEKDEETYDLVFIGDNKNREGTLIELDNYCKNNNLNNYFYVMNAPNLKNNQCKNNAYMDYRDYVKIIHKTKAILDLVEKDNYGLTFRPIEALFLNKKLITNYFELQELDYQQSNVLYLDEQSDIKVFLQRETKPIAEMEKMKYDSNKWIENFDCNK